MNPKTGEILALALQPSFDPNHFSTVPPQIRKNRAVTDSFEPGSTLRFSFWLRPWKSRLLPQGDVLLRKWGLHGGGKVIHDATGMGGFPWQISLRSPATSEPAKWGGSWAGPSCTAT